MFFYEAEGFITNEEWSEENNDRRVLKARARNISIKSDSFNKRFQNEAFFFVSDASKDTVKIGIISRKRGLAETELPGFISQIDLELKDVMLEETKLADVCKLLDFAERNEYIYDDSDEILEKFELDMLKYGICLEYNEMIFDESEKERIYKESERVFAGSTFTPELDRIYAGDGVKKFYGHPVQYMIQTDDEYMQKDMSRLLLQALYDNGRLCSRRYSIMDFGNGFRGFRFSSDAYDALYRSSEGGAVIVKYVPVDDNEDSYASAARHMIEILCRTMMKYRNKVLTVFCFPRECTKSKKIFFENAVGASFVELIEESVSGDKAETFLRTLAKDNGVRTNKKLFAGFDRETDYLATELQGIFDEWFSDKLKTSIYAQYKEIKSNKQEIIKSNPKGMAYDELMEMIGLGEAKKVIMQALDYYKAQKLFEEKGMKKETPAMHMVFTGNPGTAKTTVARLFAGIMKDNDLLSIGSMIEVGRGDLVGKFVGWTAPAIQAKFKEAKGSVLFIDEAYSLVDDRTGSFGDEAINTIVQEMENHRDDVVVIFAGYPDKMEEFLQRNPGLRSRIAFHVPFDDYDTQELCSIAQLIAKKKGITLTDDAGRKLEKIFDAARRESDFGNGRYVRNVLEKAKMAQATRLLSMDLDSITKKDVATVCAEDIEEMPLSHKPEKRKIGF